MAHAHLSVRRAAAGKAAAAQLLERVVGAEAAAATALRGSEAQADALARLETEHAAAAATSAAAAAAAADRLADMEQRVRD